MSVPPPISALITLTALTDRYISFVILSFARFKVKKAKSSIKIILYEPLLMLQVLMTSLAKEKVSRIDKDNMWLGPREEDLIHVGAKYSPCMREVTYL